MNEKLPCIGNWKELEQNIINKEKRVRFGSGNTEQLITSEI